MTEITWKVKAFDGSQAIVENFESKDDAIALYDRYLDKGCPTYLYQNDQLVDSYDPSYDEYLERAAWGTSCVYCGAHSGGGYCLNSPDGSHVMNS